MKRIGRVLAKHATSTLAKVLISWAILRRH